MKVKKYLVKYFRFNPYEDRWEFLREEMNAATLAEWLDCYGNEEQYQLREVKPIYDN